MCRHVAWLGAPHSVAELVVDPPFGLLRQSYEPRRQRHGRFNADGWGVGLYAGGRDEPARWRSDRPLWSSSSLLSLAPVLVSSCVIAAVRSATPGMPADETAVAPFQRGRWLLSHNGRVDRAVLPPHPAAESMCDSAQLAAHAFDAGPDGLADLVLDLATKDPAARLNLLVTDGTQLLATAWGDGLCFLQDARGVVLASEPYDDDPRWQDVPDHSLVHVTADGLAVTPLET
jgi:glutamine amidotransferase